MVFLATADIFYLLPLLRVVEAVASPNSMTNDTLREAETFLHERIPLTRAMGVRVVPDVVHGFAVEAPVALNYNHLHTAFGGSVNAVATLAGYAVLWLALRERIAHVVIASSSIRFLRPVREIIRAVCLPPGSREFETFKTTLREKGKARITLSVHVDEGDIRCAKFDATFVAFRDEQAATS
jgi:thioesterase domain-containing protein